MVTSRTVRRPGDPFNDVDNQPVPEPATDDDVPEPAGEPIPVDMTDENTKNNDDRAAAGNGE
eukprot:2231012-Amphidinium_carterae.1